MQDQYCEQFNILVALKLQWLKKIADCMITNLDIATRAVNSEGY